MFVIVSELLINLTVTPGSVHILGREKNQRIFQAISIIRAVKNFILNYQESS